MKVFNDINDYYPSSVFKGKQLYSDFTIIKLEDLVGGFSPEHLDRYSKPHLRGFFEICFGLREPNKADINVGTIPLSTDNGNIIFVSPLQAFTLNFEKSISTDNGKGYIIAFKPSFLANKKRIYEIINTFRFFSSHTFPKYLLTPDRQKLVSDIALNMSKEYVLGEPCSKQIIMGYLEVLLYNIKRWIKLNDSQKGTSASEFLSINFERLIIDDGNQIGTLSDYASRLNVSANYLSECIKKTTRKTARQILLNHRLIVAKSLLQQKEKSIAEIAYIMNYTEPTNFTKFFKQMTGTTPNQFRKGRKSTNDKS